jgi:hypothetical protein
MLRKNLKHVSKINFIIRDPCTLPAQGEVTREFELSVNDTLFHAYDIMEKNKLLHFEQARTMFDFIEKQVYIKRTTTACRIKGNVLLIDDVFMIQGTSSLEYSPKIRKSAVNQVDFDTVIHQNMDRDQIAYAGKTFERIWNQPDLTVDYKQEILSSLAAVYAESAATVLHKLFKPPCIIQFHDGVQGAVSFADKRLSRQHDQETVLEKQVVTPVQPLSFFQDTASLWGRTMDFNKMVNISSKRGFYLDAMTKAFICGYSSLYSRMPEFLHTPVWYDSAAVQTLFGNLETLRYLTQQKDRAVQTKDKVALNQQMKALMQELETILMPFLNKQQS